MPRITHVHGSRYFYVSMTTVLLGNALNRFETKDPNTTDSSESTVGGMSGPFNSALLDALNQRVVIGDGAMGTMLQAADLTLDDFLGLEVHGIGVQLTESLAEYWHRRVREELVLSGGHTVAEQDPTEVSGYFDLEYRGACYSFGYGACPDLEDRAKLVALLEPERIGVHLSEELQLHPEQSTDAFVLHHPEAKYFNV